MMKKIFTETDLGQIVAHGLSIDTIEKQLENFQTGFPHLSIDRAAVAGDGIKITTDGEREYFENEYMAATATMSIVKFVPASGAATRMFKDLFEYVNEGKEKLSVRRTIEQIENFAFYDSIKNNFGQATDREIIKAVIDYGAALPKGLIEFHRYADGVRTAVEEHLTEGALYAASGNQVNIHFTVSADHLQGFRKLISTVAAAYEKRYGVKYTVSYSQQQPSTDTIAVTPGNEPLRNSDGTLLFRPAGHGALIENLNAIDADIIFIKNIDNVTVDRLKEGTILFKKVLGGMLVTLQNKIFGYLDNIAAGSALELIEEIERFVTDELCFEFPAGYSDKPANEKIEVLRSILDRPLRICAMVRNEGEPGGGPFWVRNPDGSKSLQIGEPSQVAPNQAGLLKNGTHFNPVDIVCGVRTHRGGKFDLREFVDPETGFISEKSKDGRLLKALELPGLWNGSMARWNTVFVEVPVSTFTPVKEVTDLLRPEHQ